MSGTASETSSYFTDDSRRRSIKKTHQNGLKRKDILNLFNLSRTNQILQGHSPTTADSLSPRPLVATDTARTFLSKARAKAQKRKRPKKPLVSPAAKRWMQLITSELFSARVSVVPKPAEFNANIVSTDPRRGRYKTMKDYGLPNVHLCKLIRKHLLNSIMTKFSIIRPKVDSNLGKKKPSKKDLDEWKLRRGQKANEKRRRKVISTKRRKVSSRYRACRTCGDFHFRRTCRGTNRDLRINLMVKQIYQKAEVIKDNMNEAWEKLDNLESAYHDMLMKVHRLQSNRVCLGLLTGEDYPGEEHPEVCPCVENKEKEELDKKKQEEREREEERQRQLEKERKLMEKQRRERILEMRKKRFYSRMHQTESLVHFQDDTDEEQERIESSEEAEGDEEVSASLHTSSGGGDSSGVDARRQAEEEDEQRQALLFKTGLNDLTRLEASRRKRSSRALEDAFEPLRGPTVARGRPSLLTRLMEKVEGRPMDLIVMDGSIKKMGYSFLEDGSMFKVEETVKSFELEEEEEEKEADKETTEGLTAEMEEEEEEEEELEFELTEDVIKEEPEKEEEEEKVSFGDFLDVMEVF